MSAERLLLIEDDATTREVLTVLLEADGWSVVEAESGEAALATLEALHETQTRPHTILCDLHLPGLHGIALAAKLRTLSSKSVLLAISASEPGDTGGAYDGWLRKPFDPSDVRTRLAALNAEHAGQSFLLDGGVSGSRHSNMQEVELPVLASDTLLQIERQMGGRARDLYAFALADAGDRLRRMERSVHTGDATAYGAEAHALKGSACMIGAKRLASLAADAEALRREFTGSLRGKKVKEMHLACNEIRLMLETLFPA